MDQLLQVAAGDGRVAVIFINHFALLGDANTAVHRPRRLGQNRLIGRATAAGNGSATAVEQHHHHLMLAAGGSQCLLRLVQFPVSRQIPGVLVAVGIADHDGLPPLHPRQMRRIGRMGEERGHHRRSSA